MIYNFSQINNLKVPKSTSECHFIECCANCKIITQSDLLYITLFNRNKPSACPIPEYFNHLENKKTTVLFWCVRTNTFLTPLLCGMPEFVSVCRTNLVDCVFPLTGFNIVCPSPAWIGHKSTNPPSWAYSFLCITRCFCYKRLHSTITYYSYPPQHQESLVQKKSQRQFQCISF